MLKYSTTESVFKIYFKSTQYGNFMYRRQILSERLPEEFQSIFHGYLVKMMGQIIDTGRSTNSLGPCQNGQLYLSIILVLELSICKISICRQRPISTRATWHTKCHQREAVSQIKLWPKAMLRRRQNITRTGKTSFSGTCFQRHTKSFSTLRRSFVKKELTTVGCLKALCH